MIWRRKIIRKTKEEWYEDVAVEEAEEENGLEKESKEETTTNMIDINNKDKENE